MPDGSLFPLQTQDMGRIGPNAILQLQEPMDQMLGRGVMSEVLSMCGVPMPSGRDMIPETDVERVHHRIWQLFPEQAQVLSEQAGAQTARYIRKNRIPRPARMLLGLLPRGVGERLLTKAIADHAWTFCGSGRLSVMVEEGEIHFVICDNPLADRHGYPQHPCHWHTAVFAGLFSSVLGRDYHCREESCSGCGGDHCRFVVRRGKAQGHFKGLQL
jgi:divinyl protochlorophyllide a 8-vinyl-reductase